MVEEHSEGIVTNFQSLGFENLRKTCDPARLGFKTTAEIEPTKILIGQDRALGALQFGTAIQRNGYNLFVIGGKGFGRHWAVGQFLEEQAKSQKQPDEWVYVNNFTMGRVPRALRLPPGTAKRLQKAMASLIDDLQTAIPSLFETDDYRNRARAINEEGRKHHDEDFEKLRKKAETLNIAIVRSPMGFGLAPVKDGSVIKPEDFKKLDKSEQERIEATIVELQKELEIVFRDIPTIEKTGATALAR